MGREESGENEVSKERDGIVEVKEVEVWSLR